MAKLVCNLGVRGISRHEGIGAPQTGGGRAVTIIDVLWLVGLIILGVVAATLELSMASAITPRQRLRSYLMWGATGASTASFFWMNTHHGLDAALLAGLLFGLVCQPLAVTFFWFSEQWRQVDYASYGGEDGHRRDDEWMNTAFWRQGRGAPRRLALAPEAEAISDDAWLKTASWRQGRKPAATPVKPPPPLPASRGLLRAHLVLTAVALLTWPALAVLAHMAREPARREVVVGYLEAIGFEAPALRQTLTSAPCWGGVEYDWWAAAGDGRACVRDGDYVTVHLDHDRTSKDPFARPAR